MFSTRTLFLYILREQVKVFMLAVVGVLVVMNFGAMVIYLQRYPSLSLGPLLAIMPYQMPTMFPWVFPLAVLVSTTLTYGRLSADNELMAIQVCGIHLIRAVLPGLLVGLVVMVALFGVNDHLLPWCREREYDVWVAESDRILRNTFQNESKLESRNWRLAWRDYKDGRLLDVVVSQHDRDGIVAQYRAVSAAFDTDGENITLRLKGIRGTGFLENQDADVYLEETVQRIPLEGVFTRAPGYKALTSSQLLDEIDTFYLPEIGRTRTELERFERGPVPNMPEEHRLARIEAAKGKIKTYEGRVRDIQLTVHRRYSLAFSAFVFTLVGVALGILAKRGHMLSSFFLGCLPVMLLYYPVFLMGQSMADEGAITAAAACWTPAGLLGGMGAALLAWLFVR